MQQQQSKGFLISILEGWYRLTSVPVPPPSAPLAKRELSRRTRLASLTLLIITVCAIVPLPVAIFNNSIPFFVNLVITIIAYIIALALNRAGKVNIAGLVVIFVLEFGFASYHLTLPTRSLRDVSSLALLVEGVLVGIAFFNLRGVLAITLINVAFTIFVVLGLSPSKDLSAALQTPIGIYSVLTLPILIQFAVSTVLMLAMYSAQTAIQRADKAEKLAELEQLANQQKEKELETAKQVEEGIQQIITTMNAVATRNDFGIRVPLSQENILWRVGRSLNNLLARLQGLKQDQEELKKTRAISVEIARLVKEGKPIRLENWTGTAFDLVIIEYNKLLQNQHVQPSKSIPDYDVHTTPNTHF